jgi:hypothetical protein
MKLVPKIADTEVAPGTIKVYVDKSSLELVNEAVAQASEICEVDTETLGSVVQSGQRLHKLIQSIEASKRGAKRQFLDILKEIDRLAARVSLPLRSHHDRLTKMLADWHDSNERARIEKERKEREAEEAAEAQRQRQAAEAERQRQELLEAQRNAKTHEELEQIGMDLAFMDAEIITFDDLVVLPETPHAPIPGAVTTKRYRFTLVDPIAAHQYSKGLVRWEVNVPAAQDIVRALKEKGLEIKIPGIQIETYTDVSTPTPK